jgi:pimeloyl-ACP methyl ester carboxylesterase
LCDVRSAPDVRQSSQSNKPFSCTQQARDVAAIIKAMGYTKSIAFGRSLGGVIAFQLDIDYPEVVEHPIKHEAPTFMLLSDGSEFYDMCMECLEIYKKERA